MFQHLQSIKLIVIGLDIGLVECRVVVLTGHAKHVVGVLLGEELVHWRAALDDQLFEVL